MNTFKSRFVNALAWNAGGKVVSQAFSIIIGIVLARLLTPDAYGLVAMVLVFTGLAALLADVGLGSALVQKQELLSVHFNSVFWCNLGLGVTLAVTLFSFSADISNFYNQAEIEPIVQILSLGFVIGAASLVHRQVLVKSMRFKYLALGDFFGMAGSGILAIILAVNGFGFWSLVFQQITNKVIVFLTVSWSSGWKPRFEFSKTALHELLSFSIYVFLTRLLQYAAMRVDKLITGKYLGAASVGLIDKAQSMMLFPLQNISHTIGGVMFPALSSLNGDLPRVRNVYLKCIEAVAFLTFPMMAGMFVVSEAFILGVLGEHWSDLVPIFQIFCFAGVINSVATITGAVYLSQGASKLQFRVNLITRPLVIACVIVGFTWGVTGVVWGIVVAAWISGVYTMMKAWALINLSWNIVARVLLPIIGLTFVMSFVVYLAGNFASSYGFIVTLFVQILIGAIVYLILSLIFRVKALSSFREAIFKS